VSEAEPGGPERRILVVDDDQACRELARDFLRLEGFAVEEAEDGLAAIRAFTAHRPHLVLLDMCMPRMDGFETCRRVRALPGGAHVPVVVTTGLEDMDSIRLAYEAGATDFITKPMNLEILGHRVRYMLRASDAVLALRRNEKRLAAAQRIARFGHFEREVSSAEERWSREMFRIIGADPTVTEPAWPALVERIHPDERAAVSRAMEEAVREGRPFALDVRAGYSDGAWRHFHVQGEPVLGPTGLPSVSPGPCRTSRTASSPRSGSVSSPTTTASRSSRTGSSSSRG